MTNANQLRKILEYLKLLGRSLIFKVLLLADLVAILFYVIGVSWAPPVAISLLLLLPLLIWAAYEVHTKTLEAFPSPRPTLAPKADVAVELIEGSEYSYDLDYLTGSRGETILSRGKLAIHVRITNCGDLPLDLLRIGVDMTEPPAFEWDYFPASAEARRTHDGEITFPVHLDPGEVLLADLVMSVRPESLINVAQFAAMLGEVKYQKLPTEVWVSAIDGSRNSIEKSVEFAVSTQGLRDRYIEHWQKEGASDLLRLAGAGGTLIGEGEPLPHESAVESRAEPTSSIRPTNEETHD